MPWVVSRDDSNNENTVVFNTLIIRRFSLHAKHSSAAIHHNHTRCYRANSTACSCVRPDIERGPPLMIMDYYSTGDVVSGYKRARTRTPHTDTLTRTLAHSLAHW